MSFRVGDRARPRSLWRVAVFVGFWAGWVPAVNAQKPGRQDAALQSALEDRIRPFRGQVGVFARHLDTGAWAGLATDETFPTASMIKVPILIGLYDQVERGALSLHDRVNYADSLFYASDDDLVNKLRAGESVTLSKLAFLMISTSDNTASLWIQGLVRGEHVNEWLDDHGFRATRVNSRVDGRQSNQARFGWGQTTPREMAELMVMIRDGRAVSPAASSEMYRTLTKSYWDDEALAPIPATVQVASKQGAVSASRSEVLLVNGPTGDYVVCIITNGQEDQSWEEDNEGFVLLRDLSRIVWEHFATASPS